MRWCKIWEEESDDAATAVANNTQLAGGGSREWIPVGGTRRSIGDGDVGGVACSVCVRIAELYSIVVGMYVVACMI